MHPLRTKIRRDHRITGWEMGVKWLATTRKVKNYNQNRDPHSNTGIFSRPFLSSNLLKYKIFTELCGVFLILARNLQHIGQRSFNP